MAVLLDSGFLFASLNASEAEHEATIRVLESIREPIVLPIPAITEVAYLLARDIGNEAAADFVESLSTTELTLETPLQEDYLRSAEILRQYADANLDFGRRIDSSDSGAPEHNAPPYARSSRLSIDSSKALRKF
jgi:hypothetical protein